jgi:REP element-mobilizing transposase RayT
MPCGPGKQRRRSIRLTGYDYAQPGACFVTICTQDREPLFGKVEDGRLRLNPAGEMVWRWWHELSNKYPVVRTDAAVVMPNHFHGIIVIGGQPEKRQPETGQPRRAAPPDDGASVGATLCGRPRPGDDVAAGATPRDRPALGEIVGWFKTMTTNEYIRGVKQRGWPPFPGRVWQRNYYEHIVRDRDSLDRIRNYILTNPERWAWDRENPLRTGLDEFEPWIYDSPAVGEG